MTRPLFPVAAGLLLSLSLAACKNTSEAPMELGKDYFPLQVGTERVYNVVDRTWVGGNELPRITSQVREQFSETYRDAAGKLTYKIVRSSRSTASNAWRVDSVHTLTVGDKYLVLTRGTRRTVEMVFPVRDGAEWDKYAFVSPDTASEPNQLNRRYQAVGASQTVEGRSYDNTVTAFDEGDDPLFFVYRNTIRTVYAKGLGPVLRERLRLTYCSGSSAVCSGTEHTETLVP